MTRRVLSQSIFLLAIVFTGMAMCEDYSELEGNANSAVGEGMEEVKMGDATVIIPKGSKIYKHENVYTYETPEAYAARKIDGLEARVVSLEKDNKDLKQKVGALLLVVKNINRNYPKRIQK